MLPRNHPDRIQIAFDDPRLVADAGLLLPVTLAQHLGLREVVDSHVDLGDAPGLPNRPTESHRPGPRLSSESSADRRVPRPSPLVLTPRPLRIGGFGLTETSSVRVSDFGIATATDLASMTATGVIMGTPYYMSPEQAKGERADIRSDIYSLGIVLYHMLTGMRPFDADTSLAILRKHIDVMPPLVGHTRAGVPPELTAIVARCLEKDAALRYQTPEELAKALDQAAITIDRKRLSEAGTSAEAPEAEIEDLKNNQVNILENDDEDLSSEEAKVGIDDEDLSSEEAEVGIDSKEPAKAVAGMIEYEPTKEPRTHIHAAC